MYLGVYHRVGFFVSRQIGNRRDPLVVCVMKSINTPSSSQNSLLGSEASAKDRWCDDGGQCESYGQAGMENELIGDKRNGIRVVTPATLAQTSRPQPPGLVRGVISQLKFLSCGTDVPSTHLVPSHNTVGYGYIRTPAGDVFFDASALTNRRFDQLERSVAVEFALDDAPYLRTSRLSVVTDEATSHRQPLLETRTELPGSL